MDVRDVLKGVGKQEVDEGVSKRLGMGRVKGVRRCEACGAILEVRRRTKRYCGANCRKKAMRARRRDDVT